MALDRRSIKKLMQDHFRGDRPMMLDAVACQALGEEIRQRLAGIEGVEPHSNHYMSEQERARLVQTFRITDPRLARYSYGGNDLHLLLDKDGVLTITNRYDASAVVSTLDEVVAFVLHCKQRLARLQALKMKREKVRHLQAQAIIAQVKQLAKEEQFDFITKGSSALNRG